MLKRLYLLATTFHDESTKVIEFIERTTKHGSRVLDVGCGLGRYLRLLSSRGYDVTGIDANPIIVKANNESGFHCVSPDSFDETEGKYDVILLSHVIEHFPPDQLLLFVERYLDRLELGGAVVIATPLASNNFYDDFDHVKPYHPLGLTMVFGEDASQVQYYARNKLRLVDLWYRRSYWRINHVRARMFRSPHARLLQVADVLAALLFRVSGGLLGRTDGWVGLFKKTDEIAVGSAVGSIGVGPNDAT